MEGAGRPRHIAAQGGDNFDRQVELAGDDLVGTHHRASDGKYHHRPQHRRYRMPRVNDDLHHIGEEYQRADPHKTDRRFGLIGRIGQRDGDATEKQKQRRLDLEVGKLHAPRQTDIGGQGDNHQPEGQVKTRQMEDALDLARFADQAAGAVEPGGQHDQWHDQPRSQQRPGDEERR